MPIQNASGSFNIGLDCTIVVQHPSAPNGQVTVPNITEFKLKQDVTSLKSLRMDGVNLTAKLPLGWSGSFMADRGGPGVDDLFALIEAAFYASGTVLPATITQTIHEVSGSTTTWQLIGVSMSFSDAGDWKGDAIVKQAVEFEAFRRLRV